MNKTARNELLRKLGNAICECRKLRKEITPTYNGNKDAINFMMEEPRSNARDAFVELSNNVAVIYIQFWEWNEYVPTIADESKYDVVIDSNFEWDDANGKFVLQSGKSFSPEFLLSIRFPVH